MSRRGINPAQGLMVGLAVGTAVAIYRRRASLQSLSGPGHNGALPPGTRALTRSGGSAMQTLLVTAAGTMHALSTAVQGGPTGLVEQTRRYVESARAQLNVAIAEGQLAAAQTRKELEERFAAAKTNPASARSAFDWPS